MSLIREIRAAVPELVVNARVDVFVRETGGVDEAVERGNAYLAAGADCVYPIVCPAESIAELVERIDGPVNVLLTPGGPLPGELERLGRRTGDVGLRPRRSGLRRGGQGRGGGSGGAERWMTRALRPRVM